MSLKRKVNLQNLENDYNPFEAHQNTDALVENLNEIDKCSIRTKFKATQDPINLAFEAIENTSLKTLARDFVKESFYDLVSFVTDICK